jgi:YHS domain-containing protein
MTYKDPICGMDVEEDTPYTSQVNGETYYFCCLGCKEKFENNHATQSAQLVDPVCGMKVKPSSLFKSSYNDHEYLFCSKRCREEFEKNPSKFVGVAEHAGGKSHMQRMG